MSQGALPGFRDFYPEQLATRNHLMSVWRDVARKYGFVEYDGPPLEPLELYTKKSGDEIVGQLYSFTDKGDRQVALRPEMTPTLARMVAAKAKSMPKPIRWFSVPQLFRYERQQKGRLKEHFQLNVDIIGEASVAADAELAAVAIDVVRTLGLTAKDVVLRISDRRILQGYLLSLGVPREVFPVVFAVIDKLGREPIDVARLKLAQGGVPDQAREKILRIDQASVEDVSRALSTSANDGIVDDFYRYIEYLSKLIPDAGEWMRFDLSVVRGLAYYTGIVFELFDLKGEFRAICGGGRYDKLIASMGGEDLPALGFGMGDVVLTDLLRSRNLLPGGPVPVDYWVAWRETLLRPRALSVTAALRTDWNQAVLYSLKEQALRGQLRDADNSGAQMALIVDNASHGVVKGLRHEWQRTVHLDQWLAAKQTTLLTTGRIGSAPADFTPLSRFTKSESLF